eukprot:2971597-Prymnesium_polylepis.1
MLGLDVPPYAIPSGWFPADLASLGQLLPGGAFWHNPNTPINLTAAGLTVDAAQSQILNKLGTAQASCDTDGACTARPRLHCNLNKDRWERDAEAGERRERYHAPHCDAATDWSWAPGDPFVVVSFFRAPRPMTEPRQIWVHTVLYTLYVDADPSASPRSIPHAAVLFGEKKSFAWQLFEAFNAAGFEVDAL